MMDSHHTVESELKAWREAHRHLTHAVLVAKEAVAVAKAQRRYWMEEICANLTPEGNPTATSVWKKPTKTTRKAPARRKLPEKPTSQKRRRTTDETLTDDEAPIRKPKAKRRRKADEQPKKKKHVRNPKAQDTELIVEVYADEADNSEGCVTPLQVHAEPRHHGGISPAFHHAAVYPPYGAVMPQADPYGMMHQHVPDHLRPYMAQPAMHFSMASPHAPSAYMGAYASVLQGDSDDASSEE